jgi:hypothetical protein
LDPPIFLIEYFLYTKNCTMCYSKMNKIPYMITLCILTSLKFPNYFW